MITFPDQIESLADAVGILEHPEFKEFTQVGRATTYREPFGIWFRGEPKSDSPLVPSIWRQHRDECSLVYHFIIRACERGRLCRNTFDWLCLMRHFDMPARLLDWTESRIVGLYFAVRDEAAEDGTLYVLNARKLNRKTRHWPTPKRGVATPWSIETALRAEFSRTREKSDFADQIRSFDRNYVEDGNTLSELFQDLQVKDNADVVHDCLSHPIAVLPNRLDARMVFQQSVFTLHGGINQDVPRVFDDENPFSDLPQQRPLIDVSAGCSTEENFLMQVSVSNTKRVREQLSYLGIHDGACSQNLTNRQSTSIHFGS